MFVTSDDDIIVVGMFVLLSPTVDAVQVNIGVMLCSVTCIEIISL